MGLHGIQNEFHATDQAAVLAQDAIDQRRVTRFRSTLLHRRPSGALELDHVVPLTVMHGRQHGFTTFALVEGHAQVFIGEQLGAQHPDFLRVVARALHFQLVDEFHQADLLAHLLERLVTRSDRTLKVVAIKRPEIAVVVAVDGGLAIGSGSEGRALRELAVAVRQLHADVPRCAVVVGLGQQARHGFSHQGTALGNPRVGIVVRRVDPRPRHARHPIPRRGLLRGGGGVQLRPQRPHARKTCHRQGFDPGVFGQGHQGHLPRTERFGRNRLAREHHVGRGVRAGRAVKLGGVHQAIVALHGVQGVGQVDEIVLDEGAQAFPVFKVTGGGAHEKIAAPQGAQVHVDAPLHIDQQGAFALLLQHGQRLFGLQPEVGNLGLKCGAVGLCSPHGPAAQAPQGQLTQQRIELAQHGPQAARRLRHQGVEELQVLHEERCVGQSLGRGWRGGQHQLDHRTRGFGGQHECGGGQLTDHVFANLFGHLGRTIDPSIDQLMAAPQAAQSGRAFDVVVQASGRKHLGGLWPSVGEQGNRRRVELLDPFGVVLKVHRHGLACFRRRSLQPRPVHRACRGRR